MEIHSQWNSCNEHRIAGKYFGVQFFVPFHIGMDIIAAHHLAIGNFGRHLMILFFFFLLLHSLQCGQQQKKKKMRRFSFLVQRCQFFDYPLFTLLLVGGLVRLMKRNVLISK